MIDQIPMKIALIEHEISRHYEARIAQLNEQNRLLTEALQKRIETQPPPPIAIQMDTHAAAIEAMLGGRLDSIHRVLKGIAEKKQKRIAKLFRRVFPSLWRHKINHCDMKRILDWSRYKQP